MNNSNLTWIIWHVTNVCNLECKYCFTNSSSHFNDPLDSEKLLTIADKISNSGVSLVTLIGGEPLMLSSLPLIVEYLLDNNIKVNLDTNGVLLKEKWNKVYAKLNRVNISIDDIRKEVHNKQRGKYDSVIGSIYFLKEKGISFGVTITITPQNISNLDQTAEFLVNKGASIICFSRMKPIGRGVKYYEKYGHIGEKEEEKIVSKIINFYNKTKKGNVKVMVEGFYHPFFFKKGLIDKLPSCLCGDAKLTVNYDGYVYPCEALLIFPKTKRDELFSPKNLLDYSLEEILSDPQILNWKKQTYIRPKECMNCTFQLYCNSGCHILNYFFTGSKESKDVYCRLNTNTKI